MHYIVLAREKEKGNECFKAGEHENALLHYSKSICLDNSSAAVYANRGLVNFKLNNFQAGDDDCTMAIENDRTYLKAWVRRGSIRFKMGKYAEVLCFYNFLIKLSNLLFSPHPPTFFFFLISC